MVLKEKNNSVEKIYQNIVERSRSKFFYIDYGLEDSFETRFDLIIFHAFMILVGSTFYVIGGILTLKISKKKNENLTSSILIWGAIIIFPIAMYYEQPWNLVPRLDSTISLIYLGIFPTGIAWLIRFHILKKNGLVFHSQVAYLIPIFGVILGYVFLKEVITLKVLIALIAVIIGFYFVRRSIKQNLSSN